MSINAKKISVENYEKWDIPSDRKNIKLFACNLNPVGILHPSTTAPIRLGNYRDNQYSDQSHKCRLKLDPISLRRTHLHSNKQIWTCKAYECSNCRNRVSRSQALSKILDWFTNATKRISSQQVFIRQSSPDHNVKLSTINRESFGKAVSRAFECILSKHKMLTLLWSNQAFYRV